MNVQTTAYEELAFEFLDRYYLEPLSLLARRPTHYIYVLAEPSTGDVRYVGCSSNPHQRYARHCANARRRGKRDQEKVAAWINDLAAMSARPYMKIVSTLAPKVDALYVEGILIDRFANQLLNTTTEYIHPPLYSPTLQTPEDILTDEALQQLRA